MHRTENTVIAAAKRGFTLIELLVVVAILGILGTIATQNVIGHIGETRIKAAEAGVQALKDACVTYSVKHKRQPKTLDELTEGDDPVLESDKGLYDPWDNKYEMEIKGKNRIIIKSAGENGIFGDEDDIRSDDKKKKKE